MVTYLTWFFKSFVREIIVATLFFYQNIKDNRESITT